MMAARAFMFRLQRLHFIRGIEVQNPLAGIADYSLLPGANVVIYLRAQHDLARHTFVIANFGDAAAAKL